MSSLPSNPTPEQIASVMKFNEKNYGGKTVGKPATPVQKAPPRPITDAQKRAVADLQKLKDVASKNQAKEAERLKQVEQAKLAEQAKPHLTPLEGARQMQRQAQQRLQDMKTQQAQKRAQQQAESDRLMQRANEVSAKVPELLRQSNQALEDARMGRIVKPNTALTANTGAMPTSSATNTGSAGTGAMPPAAQTVTPNLGTTPGATGTQPMRRGGAVKNNPAAKFSSGGSVSKASSRGDGIAQRGKTKGRMC